MSDTSGVIASGTETPSRFMMGLTSDPDATLDEALLALFPDGETPPEGGTDADTGSDDDSSDDSDETSGPPESDEESNDELDSGGDDDASGATGEASDFSTRFQQLYGREPDQSDIDAFFDLAQWSSSLNDQQREVINTYISQGYTPKEILDANNPATPATPPPPSDPELDRLKTLAEEYKDDEQLGPVYTQMIAMREQLVRITQNDLEAQRQAAVRQVEAASNQFKDQFKLTDAELTTLQGAVARSQLMPGLVQTHGGDVAAAMSKALEFSYYQDPTFRSRLIEQEVESRATKETVHQSRKKRAASVNGTGGNGASRVAPPAKPVSGRFPMEEITKELREALSNGQAE